MGSEKTGDDYGRFLGHVLAALGWDQPWAVDMKTEADALAEIRRLRTEAGEGDEGNQTLLDMETLTVSQVNRVGGTGHFSLWLTTRAGTTESHSQSQGGPFKMSLIEQPERNLHLIMTERQAREVYDILDDALGQADSEA